MSELYELPDGWEWNEFPDVVDNYDKDRMPIKALDRESMKGEFPYYGSTGIIDYVNSYIYNGEYLLISEDGANLTVRKYPIAFIASGKFWVNNHSHVVKAKKNISINKFIEMYFAVLDLSNYITGSAQPKLSQRKLNSINIPLPSLKEQKRIVSKLDTLFEKIDKAIELHEKNIKEADAFMGSVLNEVFEELEEKYGKTNILNGIYIGCKKGYKPKNIDGKVPFIGMPEIDQYNGINTKYILEDYEVVSKGKTKFEKNAVLVGKITPCTQNNKTTIVPSNIDGGFATTEVYALHSKENMNPYYLNYYMRSKEVNDYLVSTMVGATGRQRVPSDTIKSLGISIPLLSVQQKTVSYLDEVSQKIEKTKAMQKEKLQNLKDLKASILDQAFKGEL